MGPTGYVVESKRKLVRDSFAAAVAAAVAVAVVVVVVAPAAPAAVGFVVAVAVALQKLPEIPYWPRPAANHEGDY